MNKLYRDSNSALEGLLRDGISLMCGGFGPCGVPEDLIRAIEASEVSGLTTISIDAGEPDYSVGRLISAGKVSRVVAAFIGANPMLLQKMIAGEIEVEFSPMGTLIERIRCGGAGIPAFYTKTGYGTPASQGKETREFNGNFALLETALTAGLALVKAWRADPFGNLEFNKTAQNSNPTIATAARVTVAEVESVVDQLGPDQVHLPGIYVDRMFVATPYEKRIEHRMVRAAAVQHGLESDR